MSRNLRAGVISSHCRNAFDHSRSEQSSSFSKLVTLSATAPDPINDFRCFLPSQRAFRFPYLTSDGCLLSGCNSNPKWCEKAADSFRDVLEIPGRSPNFGVHAVRPFVPFAYAPVDEVARVAIDFEDASGVLCFGNLVFRLTAVRFDILIERPYATEFVADWVVAIEVQYLHRICRFPEHFGLQVATIFAAYEGILEGQLVVLFLAHRKFTEALWLTIRAPGSQSLDIVTVYRPPRNDPDADAQLLEELRLFSTRPTTLIVGDFHAPHINWSSASADCSEAAFDQQLLRTSNNLLLTQHVMFPTRVREGQQMNCLDLVFTKSSDNIDVVNCLPPLGQSDHVVLTWEYTLFSLPAQPLDSRPNIWRSDFEQMKKHLSPIDWASTLSGNVAEDWCQFKELVHNLISNHCPIMRRRLTNRHRWLTPSLKKEANKKGKLWKRCLTDRTPESLSSYKLQRNRVKILIARDRKAFEKDLLNRAMVDPKVLYSYIRQSTRNKDPIPLLRTAEGMEISDDKDKAENPSQFVRSVVTSEPDFFSPICEDEETPTLEAVFFTETIVRNELLNLKESTSPGPDAIPAKLLKELAPEMSKPLAFIGNNWERAPKKYCRPNLRSYRNCPKLCSH
ncbi:hypothetical protein SprV_0200620500 [Sparganum proliferum]